MSFQNCRQFVHTRLNYEFNGGFARPLDRDWVANRVDLYLRYTVPSLQRQTVRDFMIWLDCRPGSEDDLAAHRDALGEAGVVTTFDAGRELIAGLAGEVEHVYVTRIDSDDLYASDALELIREVQGTARASQFYRGYTFHLSDWAVHRVAKRSPPFYTIRFAREEIQDSSDFAKWLAPLGSKRGHSVVKDRLHPVALPDARFCYLRHGANHWREHGGQRVTCGKALAEIRGRFAL